MKPKPNLSAAAAFFAIFGFKRVKTAQRLKALAAFEKQSRKTKLHAGGKNCSCRQHKTPAENPPPAG